MNLNEFLSALAYIYLGQLVAFTFCQFLLLRPGNRTQIFFWMLASGFSGVSILGAPHILTVFSNQNLQLWAASAALAGGLFRYAALGYRAKSFVQNRWSTGMVFAAVAMLPVAILPIFENYRLIATSTAGAAISWACFLVALRNRYWTNQNEFGRSLMLTGLAISVVALVARGLTSYPFGDDKLFAGASSLQLLGMGVLVVISLFMQIGFIGMLVARQDKVAKFADRRTVRAWQRTSMIAQRGRNLRDAANQRLDFIQLLTHEVKQPINNAQASLQSITPELDQVSILSERADHALERSKSALDGITLALSNVIVAGTLVANDQQWAPQATDALEILDMARLDCSPASRKRVILTPPDDHIFVECVPIFLRVALHNLFEHALALAEMDSNLAVSATVDDVKLGVAFTITGKMNKEKKNATIPLPDVQMNDTTPSQMTSLGFFVASQVAKYHSGECAILQEDSGTFNILLFIPQS